MIVTEMHYKEPVYRGIYRGTNFEFVHVKAHGIKHEERIRLEDIAQRWTYFLRFLGHHNHSKDDIHCRYRGIRNKVRFVREGETTHIYVNGPYATEIGQAIEDIPFVQYDPSKECVISYDIQLPTRAELDTILGTVERDVRSK